MRNTKSISSINMFINFVQYRYEGMIDCKMNILIDQAPLSEQVTFESKTGNLSCR